MNSIYDLRSMSTDNMVIVKICRDKLIIYDYVTHVLFEVRRETMKDLIAICKKEGILDE